MPNVLEKEPNDDIATATAYDGELPVAFNGIIEKEGDVDFFKFKAKKGKHWIFMSMPANFALPGFGAEHP